MFGRRPGGADLRTDPAPILRFPTAWLGIVEACEGPVARSMIRGVLAGVLLRVLHKMICNLAAFI